MRRLGKLTICGLAWNVYEGTVKNKDNLSAVYGFCDHAKQEIWVAEGMSPSMFRDTLRHEVRHAILEHSGAESYLKSVLKPEVDADVVIETLVRILTPHEGVMLLSERLQQ
jgi:hypothetical protein